MPNGEEALVSQRRVETLEARYQHLDDRVSAMAADMSSIKTSVDGLVRAVGDLSSPKPTNWVGIGTLILAIVVGGSEYVNLRLSPLQTEQGLVHEWIERANDLHAERGVIIGRVTAQIEETGKKLSHIDDLRHAHEARTVELEKQAAAAEVSRGAIGDYVRDVDQLGSRRWIKGHGQGNHGGD